MFLLYVIFCFLNELLILHLNFCCQSTVYYFRRCMLEHTKHQVKVFFSEMRRYFLKFITAVCFLFLLKLRWPKNKSIYHLYSQKADLNFCCYSTVYYFRRCTLEHTKHQVKVFFFFSEMRLYFFTVYHRSLLFVSQ